MKSRPISNYMAVREVQSSNASAPIFPSRSLSLGSLRSSSATWRLSMKNPSFLCSMMDGALSSCIMLWTTVAPCSLPMRAHSLRSLNPMALRRM